MSDNDLLDQIEVDLDRLRDELTAWRKLGTRLILLELGNSDPQTKRASLLSLSREAWRIRDRFNKQTPSR